MTPKEAEAVAALITSCDTAGYGARLDDLSRLLASFDMSCAFAYRYDHTPEVIHDGYSAAVSRDALSRYLKGGYLLDPFYVACISGVKEGLWRMREIAPDGFFASDFASSREVHPCISEEEGTLVEEIGFIAPLGDGASAVYSLMRRKGGSPFSAAEFRGLQIASPIIAASMRRHLGANRASQNVLPSHSDSETAFRSAFGDRLTPTQHTVVRLILRGHSNVSIASHMQITEGTAKLHRYNIYKRLNISSQSELFQLFIEYLG
ncbi:helix-turn-helix transcriptional regulator [Gemmobacter serpentinus]|uniref:helix-turn-helix transcriptional regulator n=1 Tax=Gemmobacter serpentinus TaxID=2652247 RepID=UPI00124C1EC1|nr:helix-turn-helix transcriptional regulator [Gemmobacter serpentinus]